MSFIAYKCLCLWWAITITNVCVWSSEGHARVARIAQVLLKSKRRDRINTMMRGDLVELASWEHDALRWPETAALHRHRESPKWQCTARRPPAPSCDANPGSLLCGLGYFFQHLHVAELYPAPKDFAGVPARLPEL